MRGEALLREGLVLGAGAAVVGVRVDGDATTWREEAGDLYVLGIHQLDEVLHYLVDAVLVEITVVAETEQIEFEALALHHLNTWNIVDNDMTEVGLPGFWTQRGELWAVEGHEIFIFRVLVHKRFEHIWGVVEFVSGALISKERYTI